MQQFVIYLDIFLYNKSQRWSPKNSLTRYVASDQGFFLVAPLFYPPLAAAPRVDWANHRQTPSKPWRSVPLTTNCWSYTACTSKPLWATTRHLSLACSIWRASTSGKLGLTWRAPRRRMPRSNTSHLRTSCWPSTNKWSNCAISTCLFRKTTTFLFPSVSFWLWCNHGQDALRQIHKHDEWNKQIGYI